MNQRNTDYFVLKMVSIFGENKFIFRKTKYIANSKPVIIECVEHGELKATPGNFYKQGCKKCARRLKMHNHIQTAERIHNYKYDYTLIDYLGSTSKKHTIICPIHGLFDQTLKNHIHLKNGCPECYGNKKYTSNQIINRAQEVHGDKYGYNEVVFKGVDKKININCPVHGLFQQTPYNHINNLQGCPECSNPSKGERIIRDYLEENNILFVSQKTFPDCRYIKILRFDFFIPHKNLIIEYDGKQHFEPVEFFGGREGFDVCKKRDEIKTSYCLNNNINIERISYKDDIHKILKEIL